jgi:hypothetical protein
MSQVCEEIHNSANINCGGYSHENVYVECSTNLFNSIDIRGVLISP